MKNITLVIFLITTVNALSQTESWQSHPLGLSRLKNATDTASHGDQLSPQYEIDTLEVSGQPGTIKSRKGPHDVLYITSEFKFTRPIRNKPNERGFISFSALVSMDTVIEVAGAKIGVRPNPNGNGGATIVTSSGDSSWASTGMYLPVRKYDGSRLATLPVLTVRLNLEESEFDVYASSRLLVEGAPLRSRPNERKFQITAGPEGAMLLGLVQSDINPLYVDENVNGVDDDFEMASLGKLLDSNASKSDRRDLIKEWRKTERLAPPPALFVSRPQPDS